MRNREYFSNAAALRRLYRVIFIFFFLLFGEEARAASFVIPGDVYRLSQLKEAQYAARSKRKPITVILSTKQSDCPLLDEATKEYFAFFCRRTVVLYVDTSEAQSFPGPFHAAFQSPEAGKITPRVVIFDAAFSEVLAYVPYLYEKEARAQLYRSALEEVRQKGIARAEKAARKKASANETSYWDMFKKWFDSLFE
jgi:hypothetical protein